MKRLFGKDRTVTWLLSILAVLVLFLTDCLPEYSIDTYSTFASSEWEWMLYGNGRIISAAVYWIYETYLNWSMPVTYMVSYVIGTIFMILAVYRTARVYEQYCPDSLTAVFLAAFVILNLFCIQFYLFVETGLLNASIFFAVLAFERMNRWWQGHRTKDLILTEVWLFCAVFIYQTALGIFVVLCLPHLIEHSHDFKSFVKNNFILAGMYGNVMIIAWLITRFVLANPRIGSTMTVAETIRNTFVNMLDVFLFSCHVMPKYCFALMCAGAVLLAAFVILKGGKPWRLYEIPYLIFVDLLAGFALYFVKASTDFSPRIVYPFGALAGILLVHLFVNHHEAMMKVYAKPEKFWLVLFAGVLLFQAANFTWIFRDRYRVNAKDREICLKIGECIDRYEAETGNTVKTITIYHDDQLTWNYPGMDGRGFNTRAFVEFWSDVNAINCNLNRHYERGTPQAEYNDYFYGKNWDDFSEEQLVFDGDTLHLCVY